MHEAAWEDLRGELRRLDLLLHREILRLRAAYQLSLDEFRGLYISDEQVDRLVSQQAEHHGASAGAQKLTRQAQALRQELDSGRDPGLPWAQVATEFNLSPHEADLLLLAVAPDLDPKYETLYAYLNNDITRRHPTFDLALRVLGDDVEERIRLRACLLPTSSLFHSGLLVPLPDANHRGAWLAGGFAAAPPVAHALLGLPPADDRLVGLAELDQTAPRRDDLPLPTRLKARLGRIPDLFHEGPGPIVVLSGQPGSGRMEAARMVCAALGMSLLVVDLPAVRAAVRTAERAADRSWSRTGAAVALQARLAGAGVYLDRGEALLDGEGHALAEARGLLVEMARLRRPVWLACPTGLPAGEILAGLRYVVLDLIEPGPVVRRSLWVRAAALIGRSIAEPDLEAVADRFVLTAGQIWGAVAAAADRQLLADEPESPLRAAALFEAARQQSDQSLGKLAVKVRTSHTWADLVLAPATMQQVKGIAEAIKHHTLVYSGWGFAQRIASGHGLKVLFSGSSGTGKTMAAGVIARELGLDLYKIDLSGVVSKYIGETEKNLDRIFQAAVGSNAILFFDEADALFGKRSEVKDAHDRYANIEVAYLLQKLEDHEGPVILASNLSRNIDEAFARRMHYVVEFPMPDEGLRERLWRGMFPARAPLGEDVDLKFLAAQFPIAGGDIQNVALDAAFLAARDGRVIGMPELARAMARQVAKQGRIPSVAEFKQYYSLIAGQP